MLAVTLSTLLAACTVAVKAAPTLVRRAPIIGNCNHDFAYSWDDGPYTFHDEINNAFTSIGEHTTFFVNGMNWDCIYDEDNVQAIRNSIAQGHQIGHHTWGHIDLTTIGNDQIDEQMNRLNDAFIRILGFVPAVMRPPYGGINQQVADYLSDQWGLTTVLWSDDSEDSDGVHTTEEWSYNFYIDQANNYNGAAMPLSHETYQWSVDALEAGTASYIKSKGIKLVTIAECIDVQPYQSVTGVYGTRDSSWTCDGDYVPMSLPCSQNYVTPSATTCAAIANQFGVSHGAIKAANKFVDCTNIWQGTTLCIPGQPSTQTTTTTHTTTTTTHTTTTTTHTTTSTSAPTCVQTYTVTGNNDNTCTAVGNKFGLTADQIKAANSFVDCTNIWQNTQLCIPPGGSTGPTTTTSTTTHTTSTTSSSTSAPSCVQTYTAGADDKTCTIIANKFGLTANDIQTANSFLNCADVWQWTPICIPPGGSTQPTSTTTTTTTATTTSTSSTSAPSCIQTYSSQANDTCASIGTRFGLTADQIQKANTFVTCSDIWQYTPICIPAVGTLTCTQTYYSAAGDSCDSIGAKYGYSGAQILAWNSFLTCSDIWAGTPVCV